MLTSLITFLVDTSRRFAAPIVVFTLVASLALGTYITRTLTINTDINQLLSDDLGWRKLEKAVEKAFPQKIDTMVIVLDGDTAAHTEAAAAALAAKLASLPAIFTSVSRPDALPFFHTNGLLYLTPDELSATLDQMSQAQPMLAAISTDPSLRGVLGLIDMMMQGLQYGMADKEQAASFLSGVSETINAAVEGRDSVFDVGKIMPGTSNKDTQSVNRDVRKFILTKPVLNFASLQPGETATSTLRQAVHELGLTEMGVHVRLTGSVPLNDEEFASVAEGTTMATILSGVLVLVLLFMAMKSWRIVLPIMLTLVVGLIASTAFATVAVGSLNLISVAFAVMFIGIAVDFGIQFGVRYRDQHFQEPENALALSRTAHVIAVPLSMAAGSTALGFLCFIPTSYRGVSELGLIAGVAMIIAFFLNITLLPALMTLIKPHAEKESIGYSALRPLDAFLNRKRKTLLPIIGILVFCALILALNVTFDFDPLDLKNPVAESVSTMFDIMRDPDSDAYAAEVLAPNLEAAQAIAQKMAKLPEVDHTMTLASFIPESQEQKMAMLRDTKSVLAPTFALAKEAAPSDAETMRVLKESAQHLKDNEKLLPQAGVLAASLNNLIVAGPGALIRAHTNLVVPMQQQLTQMRTMLDSKGVTINDIPDVLRRDWVTPGGLYLVEIFPKRDALNNPRNLKILNAFIDAVSKVEPNVTGTPVSIRESGRTIVSAFVHAGIYGVVSIGLLSFLILRRVRDVALMLAPLLMAGLFTLATISVIDLPLNFANIIALPLLLSLGVSYAVYFVTYWKSGHHDLLSSSMARAILFSAGTVFVAFMSLCFSAHPGTRGMGILLTIALVYCLLCTFLVLPILLKRPDNHISD